MEPVFHQDINNSKQESYFLPHNAVIRTESKSTKGRFLNSGFPLNDVLHQGPTLQAD